MQRTFRLLLLLAVVAATKATLVDRVVPEDQMPDVEDVIPTTTLLSVPEMQGELATLATHTHTGGQKTAIRQLTDTMALLEIPKDGGTQALMDRVEAMMDVVKPAIGTMKAGLDSDFTTAQGDLSTLLGAINSTHRAVLDTEKAAILAAAQKWCTAWEAKGVAVAQCTSATTNLTAFNPTISITDALYKNIGSITDCPAGTAQVDGKCPAGVVNLDEGTGQLKIGFQKARNDYYDLSTIKADECDDKDVKTGHEATNKTAYDTEIKTTLDGHVAGCTPDNNVYTTAVSSFNTNNGHRAAMYEALDKIMCYVSNINGTDTDSSTTAATDITNCKNAMQPSSYYIAKFPDYTTAAPTCPTRASYALQISSYESLSLTELWLPADTTCAPVAVAAAAPAGWSSGYSAGGTMAHPSGPLEHFGYGMCADSSDTKGGKITTNQKNLREMELYSPESWTGRHDLFIRTATGFERNAGSNGPRVWQSLEDTNNPYSSTETYTNEDPESFRTNSCDMACRIEQTKKYCNEARFTVKTCATKAGLVDSACTVGKQVGCAGFNVNTVWLSGGKHHMGTNFMSRFILPGGVDSIEPYAFSNGNFLQPVNHRNPEAGVITGTWFQHGSKQYQWFAKGADNSKCTKFGNPGSSVGACSWECYGRS